MGNANRVRTRGALRLNQSFMPGSYAALLPFALEKLPLTVITDIYNIPDVYYLLTTEKDGIVSHRRIGAEGSNDDG